MLDHWEIIETKIFSSIFYFLLRIWNIIKSCQKLDISQWNYNFCFYLCSLPQQTCIDKFLIKISRYLLPKFWANLIIFTEFCRLTKYIPKANSIIVQRHHRPNPWSYFASPSKNLSIIMVVFHGLMVDEATNTILNTKLQPLKELFPCKLIARESNINYPPRSLDMNPHERHPI